jgi:hypothetical protein
VDEVPWLPLRLRLRYFSMASASRSRMRFAIGDKADAGLLGAASVEPSDEMGNEALLLAEGT